MSRYYQELKSAMAGKGAAEIVAAACTTIPVNRIVLASSQSLEDQILTHLFCAQTRHPRIFTLDTGRLFPETYETMERTMEEYRFRYEFIAPDARELEALLANEGPDCFYRSVELRKRCCAVRKTHPLKRVLSTADAWICGLRREQAVTRSGVEPVEWDATNGLVKINPLYDWTEAALWMFIRKNNIPYNPLQDRGFRSVGCAPCTRAIEPEEDIRAGRWWWEEPEHKECGLHNRPAQ